MWLVNHGVPFEIAFRIDRANYRMSDAMRAALSIICSEFEGRKFNVRTMQFEDEK